MEEELRRKIQDVKERSDIGDNEKSIEIQRIMMEQWNKVAEKQVVEKKRTYYADGVFGCRHYIRGCQIYTECCQMFFTCRQCHDKEQQHMADIKTTTKIRCMECFHVQGISQACKQCGIEFGAYYCEKCRLWESNKERRIYHCDGCQICRCGNREKYSHCDKCGVCLDKEYFSTHECIGEILNCNCPICGEYLFTSTGKVMFLKCNHPIHFSCYAKYIKTAYQCPVCCKSMYEMSGYFSEIERMLEGNEMPDEYKNMVSEIICNDCDRRSNAPFHFIYHKCQMCCSYNTKVVSTSTPTENENTEDVSKENVSSSYESDESPGL